MTTSSNKMPPVTDENDGNKSQPQVKEFINLTVIPTCLVLRNVLQRISCEQYNWPVSESEKREHGIVGTGAW